jgi:hypothetical protein
MFAGKARRQIFEPFFVLHLRRFQLHPKKIDTKISFEKRSSLLRLGFHIDEKELSAIAGTCTIIFFILVINTAGAYPSGPLRESAVRIVQT